MRVEQLKPGIVLTGAIFPEAVQVIVVTPMGKSFKLVGKGWRCASKRGPGRGRDAQVKGDHLKQSFPVCWGFFDPACRGRPGGC